MSKEMMIEKICRHCENSFFVRLAIHKRGGGNYCSKACGYNSRTTSSDRRFQENIRITEDCWPWIGGVDKDGYGRLFLYWEKQENAPRKQIYIRANRYALEKKLGRKLDTTEDALHHCDNSSCVRPDHLFLGTTLDNNRDCLAKGRDTNERKQEQIREIRKMLTEGVSSWVIEKTFGLSYSVVWKIRIGRTFKSVK